jgi:3-hydroxyacyl-CoA dehydrogenase
MTTAACIGLGIIGSSWAVSFSRHAGMVRVFDPSPEGLRSGLAYIDKAIADLGREGLIKNPVEQRSRIRPAQSLAEALADADYVQESATENRALKQALLGNLDNAAKPDAILASSTSEIPPSEFMTTHKGAGRMLVAHPLNPPHLIPAVELCPGPHTTKETIEAAKAFLRACGQSPFAMSAERKGFVMNRLQIALIREAWHLVEEGVCEPGDVDIAVREGLARRWSVIGPYATNLLSTRVGYEYFIGAYAETLKNISDDLDSSFPFGRAFGRRIDKALGAPLSPEDYKERTESRDAGLLKMAKLAGERP